MPEEESRHAAGDDASVKVVIEDGAEAAVDQREEGQGAARRPRPRESALVFALCRDQLCGVLIQGTCPPHQSRAKTPLIVLSSGRSGQS